MRCTDLLLALSALQDEAADGPQRAPARDAADRIRHIAAVLARIKDAAAAED